MAAFTEQITFLYVDDLARSSAFYGGTLGLTLVTDQGDCLIYSVAGGAFVGVCARPGRVSPAGVIVTLVTDDVDGWHARLVDAAVPCDTAPRSHPDYQIYQAFYRDPDGHVIEIQRFHDAEWSKPLTTRE